MTLMALLLTLRLASGIATYVALSSGTNPAVVSLPSAASLADGDDASGGYVEGVADGAPVTVQWGADGMLEPAADAGLVIERVEIVLRAKRETVTPTLNGTAIIWPALDQVSLGGGTALDVSPFISEITAQAPGGWTAALINAARWGWRIHATTGDGLGTERGWILDYAVKVYGERADTRSATLRAGAREA